MMFGRIVNKNSRIQVKLNNTQKTSYLKEKIEI